MKQNNRIFVSSILNYKEIRFVCMSTLKYEKVRY